MIQRKRSDKDEGKQYLTIPKFHAVFIFAVLIFAVLIFAVLIFAHPLHRQCNSSFFAYYFSPPARK